MATRPRTIREMQADKEKETISPTMTIQNICKQLIKIHLRPPEKNGKKVDFFVGAEDINLNPLQTHVFKKSRLWLGQVDRLQKTRKIVVLKDSEVGAGAVVVKGMNKVVTTTKSRTRNK